MFDQKNRMNLRYILNKFPVDKHNSSRSEDPNELRHFKENMPSPIPFFQVTH